MLKSISMKYQMFLNYKGNFVVIGILEERVRRLGMVLVSHFTRFQARDYHNLTWQMANWQ